MDYLVLEARRPLNGALLVLRGEQVHRPVLSALTPVWLVHLHHLVDPETQALREENKEWYLIYAQIQPCTVIALTRDCLVTLFI